MDRCVNLATGETSGTISGYVFVRRQRALAYIRQTVGKTMFSPISRPIKSRRHCRRRLEANHRQRVTLTTVLSA